MISCPYVINYEDVVPMLLVIIVVASSKVYINTSIMLREFMIYHLHIKSTDKVTVNVNVFLPQNLLVPTIHKMNIWH